MQTILHTADSRGDANHGWLHSKHSFSFANYYNPEKIHFGVLRVLNDDYCEGWRRGEGRGCDCDDGEYRLRSIWQDTFLGI